MIAYLFYQEVNLFKFKRKFSWFENLGSICEYAFLIVLYCILFILINTILSSARDRSLISIPLLFNLLTDLTI